MDRNKNMFSKFLVLSRWSKKLSSAAATNSTKISRSIGIFPRQKENVTRCPQIQYRNYFMISNMNKGSPTNLATNKFSVQPMKSVLACRKMGSKDTTIDINNIEKSVGNNQKQNKSKKVVKIHHSHTSKKESTKSKCSRQQRKLVKEDSNLKTSNALVTLVANEKHVGNIPNQKFEFASKDKKSKKLGSSVTIKKSPSADHLPVTSRSVKNVHVEYMESKNLKNVLLLQNKKKPKGDLPSKEISSDKEDKFKTASDENKIQNQISVSKSIDMLQDQMPSIEEDLISLQSNDIQYDSERKILQINTPSNSNEAENNSIYDAVETINGIIKHDSRELIMKNSNAQNSEEAIKSTINESVNALNELSRELDSLPYIDPYVLALNEQQQQSFALKPSFFAKDVQISKSMNYNLETTKSEERKNNSETVILDKEATDSAHVLVQKDMQPTSVSPPTSHDSNKISSALSKENQNLQTNQNSQQNLSSKEIDPPKQPNLLENASTNLKDEENNSTILEKVKTLTEKGTPLTTKTKLPYLKIKASKTPSPSPSGHKEMENIQIPNTENEIIKFSTPLKLKVPNRRKDKKQLSAQLQAAEDNFKPHHLVADNESRKFLLASPSENHWNIQNDNKTFSHQTVSKVTKNKAKDIPSALKSKISNSKSDINELSSQMPTPKAGEYGSSLYSISQLTADKESDILLLTSLQSQNFGKKESDNILPAAAPPPPVVSEASQPKKPPQLQTVVKSEIQNPAPIISSTKNELYENLNKDVDKLKILNSRPLSSKSHTTIQKTSFTNKLESSKSDTIQQKPTFNKELLLNTTKKNVPINMFGEVMTPNAPKKGKVSTTTIAPKGTIEKEPLTNGFTSQTIPKSFKQSSSHTSDTGAGAGGNNSNDGKHQQITRKSNFWRRTSLTALIPAFLGYSIYSLSEWSFSDLVEYVFQTNEIDGIPLYPALYDSDEVNISEDVDGKTTLEIELKENSKQI